MKDLISKNGKRLIFFVITIFILFVIGRVVYVLVHNPNKKQVNEIQLPDPVNPDSKLSEQNSIFLERFINALNSTDKSKVFYDNLQEFEETKPAYDEFEDYLVLLRKIFADANVVRAIPMNEEEVQLYSKEIASHLKDFPQLKDKLVYYWFEFDNELNKNSNTETNHVPMVFMKNDDADYTLSDSWIKSANMLWGEFSVYWKGLFNNDAGRLISGLTASTLDDSIKEIKEKKLIDYYNQLTSDGGNIIFELVSVRGDSLQFLQNIDPRFANKYTATTIDNNKKYSRIIEITHDSLKNSETKIYDPIPVELNKTSFKIKQNQRSSLGIGDEVDNNVLSIFGPWLSVKDVTQNYRILHNVKDNQYFNINYNNVILTVKGRYNSNNQGISGTLTKIVLLDEEYSLDNDIRVGQSKTELLETYPFIDNNDYVISDLDGKTIKMDVYNDRVLNITIEEGFLNK